MLQNQQAFTLLELLTVLTIISVLSLVAVPQYKEYRARAFDTVAQLDLKSIAIAEEAYFFDNQNYLACSADTCLELPGIKALSKGITVSVESPAEDHFIATSQHAQGTGKEFVWDNQAGGMR